MTKSYTEIFILQKNKQNIFKKLLEIFFINIMNIQALCVKNEFKKYFYRKLI